MASNPADRLRVPNMMDTGPSPEDLKQALEDKATAAPPELKDSKKERIYKFPFSWTAPSGEVFEGTFTNNILPVGARIKAGAVTAELIGNKPFEAIPDAARNLAVALGWMAYSLNKEGRPEWATNLNDIDDENLVLALFGEVWDHQATFLGRADNPKSAA